MRYVVLGVCWVLLGCDDAAMRERLSPGDAQATRPRARNVILVTVDTLRADVLGAYGGDARTPAIDELARSGWLFSQCYSASMLTNPAHASLMTSLYPRDHGVYDNESGIQDGARTLAVALARRGMQTGAVIGFAHLNPKVSNLGQGFEHGVLAERTERRADSTSREALTLIDSLDWHAPFFLWLHYTDPHAPYDPPADHPPRPRAEAARIPMTQARRAATGIQRRHPWFRRVLNELATTEELRARYVAEVEVVDAGIATLVAGLRTRSLLDDTALVITADHGENLGEHELYFHHGGLYAPTVHVPLIVHAPGLSAGSFDAMVESVDVAPTVLDLVGVPRWEPMRGRSLRALAESARWARRYAFSEHMERQQVAVRSAEGLLILHQRSSRQFPTYPFVAGQRERLDVRADPREQTLLRPDDPRADELEQALGHFLEAGLHLAARPAQERDEASLRALGYVE